VGYIWVYPREDQLAISGTDNLSYYIFASAVWRKAFCKTCGVHIINDLNPLTDEQVEALPEATRKWRAGKLGIRPLNLRVLNNFDVSKLKITRGMGSKLQPEYVNP
jgi:hypothetical protein